MGEVNFGEATYEKKPRWESVSKPLLAPSGHNPLPFHSKSRRYVICGAGKYSTRRLLSCHTPPETIFGSAPKD